MSRRRRTFEPFNLSFLDVVSCGFGAIVLLLVIVKVAEPELVEQVRRDTGARIKQMQGEYQRLEVQASRFASELVNQAGRQKQLQEQVTALQAALARQQEAQRAIEIDRASRTALVRQLTAARQELTEEMRRLQASRQPSFDDLPIGGLPVDSEYIIFVIDTSGSMQQHAWPAVRRKMSEIMEIYPRTRGIQVMNDMGDYLFSQYRGRWIPDTPARRTAILKRLASWTPFSNSSPVEGVTAAIRRFYALDKKISIYIFGDDFSRGTIQEVVDTVDAINRSLEDGSRRVRIHAVGFPVLFDQPGAAANVARFAALMRRLAEDNDGSFVGLTTLK